MSVERRRDGHRAHRRRRAKGGTRSRVAPGANHRLTVEMAQAHEAVIAWAEVLLCQLEIPLVVVRWALETARRHGVPTILNPAPAQPLGDELLALVELSHPERERGGRPVRPAGRRSRLGARGGRAPARAGRRPRARHPGRRGASSPSTAAPRSTSRPFRSRPSTRPPRATPSTARSPSASPRAAISSRPSRSPAPPPRSPARSAARRTRCRTAPTSRRTCSRSAAPERRSRPPGSRAGKAAGGGAGRALRLGHADPQPARAHSNGPRVSALGRASAARRSSGPRGRAPCPHSPPPGYCRARPRLPSACPESPAPACRQRSEGSDAVERRLSAGGGRGACRRGRWRRGLACARAGPS